MSRRTINPKTSCDNSKTHVTPCTALSTGALFNNKNTSCNGSWSINENIQNAAKSGIYYVYVVNNYPNVRLFLNIFATLYFFPHVSLDAQIQSNAFQHEYQKQRHGNYGLHQHVQTVKLKQKYLIRLIMRNLIL